MKLTGCMGTLASLLTGFLLLSCGAPSSEEGASSSHPSDDTNVSIPETASSLVERFQLQIAELTQLPDSQQALYDFYCAPPGEFEGLPEYFLSRANFFVGYDYSQWQTSKSTLTEESELTGTDGLLQAPSEVYQRAIRTLTRAQLLFPHRFDIRQALLQMLHEAREYQKEHDSFKELLEYSQAHLKDLQMADGKGLPDPKEKYLVSEIITAPERHFYYGKPEHDEWMKKLLALIESAHSEAPDLWHLKGKYELTRGDKVLALKHLKKAHQGGGSNPYIRLSYAKALWANEAKDEAKGILEELLKENTSPEIYQEAFLLTQGESSEAPTP